MKVKMETFGITLSMTMITIKVVETLTMVDQTLTRMVTPILETTQKTTLMVTIPVTMAQIA